MRDKGSFSFAVYIAKSYAAKTVHQLSLACERWTYKEDPLCLYFFQLFVYCLKFEFSVELELSRFLSGQTKAHIDLIVYSR
jgi:hypothetical protein